MAVGPRSAHVERTEFEYRLHDAGCNLVSELGTTVRKPLAVGDHTGTGVTGEYVAGNPRRGPVRRGREPLADRCPLDRGSRWSKPGRAPWPRGGPALLYRDMRFMIRGTTPSLAGAES